MEAAEGGRAEVLVPHWEKRVGGLAWGVCLCWSGELPWLCVATVSDRGQVSGAAPSPHTGGCHHCQPWTGGTVDGGTSAPVPAWHMETRTAKPTQGPCECCSAWIHPKIHVASSHRASAFEHGPHCAEDFPPLCGCKMI